MDNFYEVQITLHVRGLSARDAQLQAENVMSDGRKNHPNAYIHYIEDVIQLAQRGPSMERDPS